jgi:divinyl protochlorophyllide a 8-vinyl-reductase
MSGHRTNGDGARIGPNAILQAVAAIDRELGAEARRRLLKAAGVDVPPLDSGMIPEGEARAVHDAIRELPEARKILRLSGLSTADYILANRIPTAARLVIRSLPEKWGARLLSAAILRHAWTFAGSGRFRIAGTAPLIFEISDNPLRAARSESPACHWHAAVFERLFAALVWPSVRVEEISCISAGDECCRFVLHAAPGRAGHVHPTLQ